MNKDIGRDSSHTICALVPDDKSKGGICLGVFSPMV